MGEINITGTETLEELEAMLNEADKADDEPGTGPTEKDVKQEDPAPSAEEGKAKTESGNEPAGELEGEIDKAVLSKDGQHTIPYAVLERERRDRQALAERVAQLEAAAAEREKLQQVLEKHGIDPGADPDAIDPAKIEELARDYPEIGGVMTAMARKIAAMEQTSNQPKQQQPAIHPVQAAINAVPELAAWQAGDVDRFTFATDVDERLQNDPAWKDKPMTERFAEVARRTKAAFGDTQEPAKPAQPVKPAKAADPLPASPSDVGQTVQHSTQIERMSGMTQEQLMAEMGSMTPAQIEALLAEIE